MRKIIFIIPFVIIGNLHLFSQSDCPSSTPLTPGSQQCGTNSNAGSFPDGGGSPTNPCNNSYNDGEYWFTYTGTGQSLQLDISALTATYSGLFVLDACPSSAPNCIASYTSSSSSSDFTLTTPALTNGNTYYIVLANWASPYQTDFCLDASVVAPLANDDCSGAVSLTVNPDFNCGTTTPGTVVNASPSSQSSASCSGTEDDDVWFSFVATGTSHSVDILNISGSATDMYHSVWTGTCPSLSLFAGSCSDPNNQTLTGLTPGTTYYVRVYTYTSTSGQTSTFDVCIGTPPPPPVNDECSGAISLTMSSDGSCNAVSSDIYSGTDSGISSCGGTANDDVWFSFVATNDSAYVDRIADFDSEVEVFDGCSGSSLGCQDSEGSFALTGLTVGNTYWIRIHSWSSTVPSSGNTGFTICVFGPSPPPANVMCGSMEPICSDSPITFTASAGGTEAETVAPGNNYDCLSTSPNPTWYYMEIQTSGIVAIDITAGSDVDFALWGPYSNLTNAQSACGSLPVPADCSYSISATEQANTNATAGDVYILLVTNYANVSQGITLNSAASNTALTNCSIVLPITLINFEGVNIGNKNKLKWTTSSEINNDYFVIESSENSIDFMEIGRVVGAGNSNNQLSYTFNDMKPAANTMYYRLKQVDFNGQFEYFNIISVKSATKFEVNIYPNPSKNNLFFDLSVTKDQILTFVYTDIIGNKHKEIVILDNGANTYKSRIFNKLNNGIYFVQIIDKDNKIIKQEKIIKQ